MMCYYPAYGTTAMVQAKGGPVLSSGGNTNGQISLLAGATGDCQNLFSVTNGGGLDAEGMWNEGDWARTSGLVNLTNTSGKLSVACMSWNLLKPTLPMVSTNNFSGTFTFLLNHLNQDPQSYSPMIGNGTNCNIFSGYNDWGTSNKIGATTDSVWQDSTSPAAHTVFIGNAGIYGALDVVVDKVHNVLPDSNSVLNDMAQLRAVRSNPPYDMTPGVTDVKLIRVVAWGAQNKVAAHFNSNTVTSVNEINNPETAGSVVSLYPTLVQQQYAVKYTLTQGGPVSFTVFDVLGRQVSEQYTTNIEGAHTMYFTIDNLPNGIYYMRFESGNIIETKKFIVAR